MQAKHVVAVAGFVVALAAHPALAQQKTLTVAGYGGSWEQTLRKAMFPDFEAKHGVKIEYSAGNSTDTLAKLQAQKANQVIDVAIVDDGPMYLAIQLGFCAKIEGLATDDLYETAKFKDDKAVAVGQTGTGFMVNTKAFKDKGWPIPTSWNDLKDEKFKKLLVIPPINNTYGLYTLMMYARMNGGGEKAIEPGFKVMKEQINPERARLRAVARQDDGAVPVGPGRDRGMGYGPRAGLRQHRLPRRFHLPEGGRADPAGIGLSGRQGQHQSAGARVHQGHDLGRGADRARQGDGQRPGQQEGRRHHEGAGDGARRRARQAGARARLGRHQRISRGVDQALEPRGRALNDLFGGRFVAAELRVRRHCTLNPPRRTGGVDASHDVSRPRRSHASASASMWPSTSSRWSSRRASSCRCSGRRAAARRRRCR